jgi:AcrR family transcriptional regulator
MSTTKVRTSQSRLSREEWLEKALDILAEKHNALLNIDALVKRMGVTKGSFYWHFKDRDDFLTQLLDYWVYEFNEKVPEALNKAVGGQDAKIRLRFLLAYLVEHDCAKYDMLVRSWAAQDPKVDKILVKIDKLRLNTVTALFTEIGFSDTDAKIRARIFVTFVSLRAGLFVKTSKREELAAIDTQVEFFTQT